MSTYIRLDDQTRPDYEDCCPELDDYLDHLTSNCGNTIRTANIYYVKIREFLQYLITWDRLTKDLTDPSEIKKRIRSITSAQIKQNSISGIAPELIRNATREMVDAYIIFTDKQCHNCEKTRKDKLSAVRSFYDYLVTSKGYPVNPAQYADAPKQPQKVQNFLTKEDAQRLLDASVRQKNPERDYCITLLFLMTGMRLSELCRLDTDSIDQVEGTFRILGKGKKEREGYANAPCLNAVNEWLDIRAGYGLDRDEKALFVSNKTKSRLTARGIEKIIEKELKDAGLSGKGYHVHSLRHSYASFLYERGAGLVEIRTLLGHSSTKVTELYTHLNEHVLCEASRTLEDIP